MELTVKEIKGKSSNEEHLHEISSSQTFESSAHIFTLPELPKEQPQLPLLRNSQSPTSVLTQPELQEKIQEPGLNKGITESSPLSEAQSNEGLKSKKRKFQETFMDLVNNSLEMLKMSKSNEERHVQLKFVKTLADAGIQIKSVIEGSIIVILEFLSLAAVHCFGALYNSGMVKSMLQDGFVTEDFLTFHGLSSVTLTVEVKKEDYQKCLETLTQGKYCNTCLLAHL